MNKAVTILISCFIILESALAQPAIIQNNNSKISFEKVTGELQNPWGMAFLPNGDILVTEKSGDIKIVRDGKCLKEKIQEVPEIYLRSQGGLMDIELHPDFVNNQWIYLSYSSSRGSGSGGNTAVSRYTLNGFQLTEEKHLTKVNLNTTKGAHFGSRLAFDNDGYLYFSIGDRHNRDVNPQDISRDGGKIYRIKR